VLRELGGVADRVLGGLGTTFHRSPDRNVTAPSWPIKRTRADRWFTFSTTPWPARQRTAVRRSTSFSTAFVSAGDTESREGTIPQLLLVVRAFQVLAAWLAT
jgi:hypothetical protein